MKHIISVLVQNKSGVLARVAGLFSGRGFNIDSLCVAETQDPTKSRMTIVAHGDDRVLEQVNKQLNKLIDVIKVTDFEGGEYVDRELLLVKVSVNSSTRPEVMQIVDIFRARIVSVNHNSLIVEVTGDEGKVAAFIDLLQTFGIKEITRTGKIAMSRK
ncbi:MAG: acetolactate synthase small subunit [bacterium]|nr:acetolactate synthase small subunit [bacterium]